jgi:hypothetical protein
MRTCHVGTIGRRIRQRRDDTRGIEPADCADPDNAEGIGHRPRGGVTVSMDCPNHRPPNGGRQRQSSGTAGESRLTLRKEIAIPEPDSGHPSIAAAAAKVAPRVGTPGAGRGATESKPIAPRPAASSAEGDRLADPAVPSRADCNGKRSLHARSCCAICWTPHPGATPASHSRFASAVTASVLKAFRIYMLVFSPKHPANCCCDMASAS